MSKTLGKRKNVPQSAPHAQFKKPYKYRAASKQAVQAMVAAAIRQVSEKKYFDTDNVGLTSTTGGAFFSVNNMAPGVQDNERVGTTINMSACGYRMNMHQVVGATSGGLLRVILFVDHQANGAAPPAVTTLLTAAKIDAYRNLDNIERFEFLHDDVYELNASAGVSGTVVLPQKFASVYKKYTGKAHFAAGAGAVIPNTDAIGVLVIGNNTAVEYEFTTRCRFTDQ